jgi:single-strand selective monofunctional uracil DNA glycosylase
LIAIARDLRRDVERLTFGPPVTHVYDPLDYARAPHEAYLERFGRGPKDAFFLGMNPGPWGMAQTGVPFGDVLMVRDWMGIEEPVGAPARQHPARPVRGFACTRREGSGMRLWGWARETFGTAEAFFARFFVLGYCPLSFMEESGRNRTPDKLPAAEREPLFAACDRALVRVVETLSPRSLVAIGVFAEQRIRAALGDALPVHRILHPSPASPLANRGWSAEVNATLRRAGLL